MLKNKVLIVGISGQDGLLLAQYLLKETNYEIVGTFYSSSSKTLEAKISKNVNFNRNRIKFLKFDILNDSISKLIKDTEADQVYLLAWDSSVGRSFINPYKSYDLASALIDGLKETKEVTTGKTKVLFASSGDLIYTKNKSDNYIHWHSPYAAAKSFVVFSLLSLRSCGAVIKIAHLFPHESQYRSDSFLLPSLLKQIRNLNKSNNVVNVGNTEIVRDWGWAEEYVCGMALLMLNDKVNDAVFCTGHGMSVSEVINFMLDYHKIGKRNVLIKTQNSKLRSNELLSSIGMTNLTRQELGWKAKLIGKDVVYKLCDMMKQDNNS
jgi:GDPmannose 4,6-dehydratase